MADNIKLISEKIRVENSAEAINDLFVARGWSDGLPIIPPTEERVAGILSSVDNKNPQEVVAVLPPRLGAATLEKIAINAVMAGCLPDYLPVIVAALKAISDEKFGLRGVQSTTHPCSPLIVVNGPIAKRIGLNSKGNAFGPGFRANATIGRALRLILINIGGAIPGQIDKSTQGQPSKYTYCVAENEEENPWQPLHIERGFKTEDSTVTVFAAEGPHNINEHNSVTGKGILMTIAATMATPGNNNALFFTGEPVLMLCPEHAATIAEDGFSKEQVKDFLFQHARYSLKNLSKENLEYRRKFPDKYGEYVDSELVPIAKKNDFVVMVLGGPGKQSCFVPTFGNYSVTKIIEV
ncbi:MAG: hypothetical protein ACXVBZ_09660 [Flavisolibacter sp.]